MRRPPGQPSMTSVRPLVELAQLELTGEPPKRHAARVESVERRSDRQQRLRRGVFGAVATGILGVACVLALLLANRGEALRLEVLSGSMSWDGSSDCSLLRFSDGSEVAIGAGALLRIAALDSRGAELRLERGSARVAVVHRPGMPWRLRAGDYQMDGSGAAFDVDFDPSRQRLSLELASGSLSVRGPSLQVRVKAGEHLSVDPLAEVGVGADPDVVQLERGSLIARCSPRDAEPQRKHH